MTIWQGYIFLDRALGIDEPIKNMLKNKAIGTEQHNVINFRYSLNNEKTYFLVCLDIQGQDIDDFLNTLNVDSFTIFGNKTYPEADLKAEFQNSCKLALVSMNLIINEFQNDPLP